MIQSAPSLDDAAKSLWRSDAKEMFFKVVATDQLLPADATGDATAARTMLTAATSCFEQVVSELRALGESVQPLLQAVEQAFGDCQAYFIAAGVNNATELLPETPPPRVVKKSEEHYELPCAICGRIAVAVKRSEGGVLKGTVCAGITRAVSLKPADLGRVFGWLAEGNLSAFHDYMETEADVQGGMDAYCPSCDKIYCRTHYAVREFWDEGFYDCSHGTCPEGHEREIDD